MKTIVLSFACLLAVALLAAQTTILPKTTVLPKTTAIAGGGAVTWTLAQHKENFTCSGTGPTAACAATVTALGAGHAAIVLSTLFAQGTTPTFGSVAGDAGLTHCPAQLAANQYSAGIWEASDCAYATSLTGSGTTVTFTWAVQSGNSWNADIEVLELVRSTGTATLETGGTQQTTSTCATCTGPTPVVTGNADVVAVVNANENDCTAVASPYNTSPSPQVDNSNVFGIFGWSLSQTSANTASYTCTSGGTAMSTVSFK